MTKEITMEDLADGLDKALKKVEELKAENKNLTCQLRIMREKYEEQWLANKLQMSKIVEYRRIIEHYEDGAPMYVPQDG